jgi:hypothetical protein
MVAMILPPDIAAIISLGNCSQIVFCPEKYRPIRELSNHAPGAEEFYFANSTSRTAFLP